MEGEGVPIRFPAIAELEVDSRDRYRNDRFLQLTVFNNPTSSSSITFPVRQSLLSGYFTRIALSEFQIQWNTPNFTPRNNTFYWYDDGLNAFFLEQVTAPRFYDLSGLGVEMVNKMNAAVGFPRYVVNLSYLNGNPILDIQTNNGDQWGFEPYSPLNPDETTVNVQRFYATAGITNKQTHTQNPSNIQGFGLTARLTYTDYIDLVSDRLAKFAKVKDNMTRQLLGQTSVLARIYLTPFGTKERFPATGPFTMSTDYTTPKYIRWNPEEYINDFDLTLYDQYGEVLYCDPVNYPGYITEYQLTIQASET